MNWMLITELFYKVKTGNNAQQEKIRQLVSMVRHYYHIIPILQKHQNSTEEYFLTNIY